MSAERYQGYPNSGVKHCVWQRPLQPRRPRKDGIWRPLTWMTRPLHYHRFFGNWPRQRPRLNTWPNQKWRDWCVSSDAGAILRPSCVVCRSSPHGRSSNCRCKARRRWHWPPPKTYGPAKARRIRAGGPRPSRRPLTGRYRWRWGK